MRNNVYDLEVIATRIKDRLHYLKTVPVFESRVLNPINSFVVEKAIELYSHEQTEADVESYLTAEHNLFVGEIAFKRGYNEEYFALLKPTFIDLDSEGTVKPVVLASDKDNRTYWNNELGCECVYGMFAGMFFKNLFSSSVFYELMYSGYLIKK